MTADPAQPILCGGDEHCVLLKDHVGECTGNLRWVVKGVHKEALQEAQGAAWEWENHLRFRRTVPRRYWGVPDFHDVPWDDDHPDPDPEGYVESWAESVAFDKAGQALILMGGVGSGKTYYAMSLVKYIDAHERIDTCVTSTVDLFRRLRPEGGSRLEDFTEPVLLVLDDVGIEKPSEWTEEILFALVDARWRDCKPTIVTTNLTPDELKATVGTRVFDRLRDGAISLVIPGPSRRGVAA